MRLLRYGERAVLVELDDAGTAAALGAALREVEGVAEAVPGACTVLVCFADGADQQRLWARVRAMAEQPPPAAPGAATEPPVDIPVRYDGADLETVAALTELTQAEVVRRHAATVYTAAFCGFAPGFAYLAGLDPALHVARLGQPRTNVPAGSVAVAGPYSAVYPRATPGGWRLLGHTEVPVWDPQRSQPALLRPGTVVRFVPT